MDKMDKMKELEWYVILPDINENKDKQFHNIFNSIRFRESLMNLKWEFKKDTTIDLYEAVRKCLSYAYRAKAEYEIIVTALFGKQEHKIDIYTQVMLNYIHFYKYLMDNWNLIPTKSYQQQSNEKKKRLNGPGPKYQCAKCKDIIQSKSVHDFVWCKCKAIAIDGGGYYTKLTGNPEDLIYIGDK